MKAETKKIVCETCGWDWLCKSKAWIVNCPSCRKPVDNKIKEKLEQVI